MTRSAQTAAFDHKHPLVVESLRNQGGAPNLAFEEINQRDPALLDGIAFAEFREILWDHYELSFNEEGQERFSDGFPIPEPPKPRAATATTKVPKARYVNVPIPFLKDRRLTPIQKIVMVALKSYDWSGNGCYPSHETLARDLTISRRTVMRTIAALVRAGFVVVSKRPGGTTNYYTLCHFDTPSASSSHEA